MRVFGLHRFFAAGQSGFARKVKSPAIIAAVLLSAPVVSFAAGGVTAQPQVVHGHVPKITRNLSPLGRLDSNYHMEVAIGLPLRNRGQLTNLLEDIYNPSGPNFRHFLKPDEFAASFAPSAEDYQSVIDFAKAHNLTVTRTHSNRTLVHLGGSVADIENAFHIRLQTFAHPKENRNFFAPDVEPSLDLATPVLAISGLDNYVRPRPMVHLAVRPLGGGSGGGGGGGGGSGSGGSYMGYDFRAAYLPNVTLMGDGQSVGLFELTGYSAQDILDYESETALPEVPLQNVLVDGFDGSDTNVDYAVECTVDIEMAISMAPNLSSVIVYEGPAPDYVPPLGTNAIQYEYTTDQINDVLNTMATDNAAKQLSCSYQMDVNLSTMQIFQQYAAQGQSFFQASGDSGAFPAAVDEPSDNPCITVVGGTTLSTSAGNWSSEVVWLTPAANDPLLGSTPLMATGGGISTVYPIPSWQQGISMTANQGSTTMRNLPDVAMIANNIDIVFGNDAIGLSFDFVEAGTSLAAPLWAGFAALANEQAALNQQPPVGFLNPALYAIGRSTNYSSCFHDITSGNNFNDASPAKYAAVAGYDLCTGWGSMKGADLMKALLAPPAETLQILSPLGFTSQGGSGGPFSVTTQTYTLTNTGATPLTWSLINTSDWLTVSATGGVLNPGGSATVTVSLNANAGNFLINHASGNVTFNNLTAGTMQNRQFDLYVGNGGFETGDLTYWTYVGDTNLTFALAGDDVDVAGANALDGEPDELFVHSGIYGGYLGQWPDNGTLSQTVPTTVGQPLLVSFWLTSVPEQGQTTPNGFAAKWNGSTLFTATNLPVLGWTNLQYIVSPAGGSGTLEFDFNNTPGAFGLDDVTVQTVPAPMLGSTAVSGGNIAFSWSAYPNVSYQIQATASLGGVWTNVGGPILATNNVMNISLPVGGAPERFYRVAIPPQ
jgi:hypothetical protein